MLKVPLIYKQDQDRPAVGPESLHLTDAFNHSDIQ